MCCEAAMFLKGEGMAERNTSRALELYTRAADMGSVKALNGLGFIYFYGQGGLQQNYVSRVSINSSIRRKGVLYAYTVYI